ncbi:MAG: HD domain-containing protein [Clostridia bacterium]|nr:HD domain-containing protein [Clostridia bacterium]
MLKYETLSKTLSEQIEYEKQTGTFARIGFDNRRAVRRNEVRTDTSSVWRPTFVHDIDKIMHCPYYNRYTDKTQVFSLIKNDDITRRSLHVQLVSRIARTIGNALNLNLDLIEAIALGHDIGHPPFAHTGEHYLDELYFAHTSRHFYHNIHSVRVLDRIFPLNISLQTLAGIASHNGEQELEEYRPVPLGSFEEFDRMIERCYEDRLYAAKILPSTLEGSVVRIADIIAYLGKDRQDAARVKIVEEDAFVNEDIGSINAELINNLVVNIIENSYGKPYIKLDRRHFKALQASKRDNYSKIYDSAATRAKLDLTAKPMMAAIYGQMLEDLVKGNRYSPIFTHHLDCVDKVHYKRTTPYTDEDPNQIVVDYIAGMTENYFIELHRYLFPQSELKVNFLGYFDDPSPANTEK